MNDELENKFLEGVGAAYFPPDQVAAGHAAIQEAKAADLAEFMADESERPTED